MSDTKKGRKKIDWAKFGEMVGHARQIVLTSHVRPDGDSLGSQLALDEALRTLGKTPLLVNSDPVPPTLAFLDPDRRVRKFDELTPEEGTFLNSADLLIALDTSSWAQLGKMAEFFRKGSVAKAVIDHHVLATDMKAEFFVDSDAEATGGIVLEAMEALGIEITPRIATRLFVAMATDTGWFRFGSVHSGTLEKAARLVHAGAKPDEIYRELYERQSLGQVRLTGRTLAKIEPFFDGVLMFTALFLDDFEAAEAHPSESEDLVNKAFAVAGSRLAVIVVEQRTGGFKISFRSRSAVDCSRVAAQFGGGGHEAAAGAFLDRPYAEVKETVLDAMRQAWEDVVDLT